MNEYRIHAALNDLAAAVKLLGHHVQEIREPAERGGVHDEIGAALERVEESISLLDVSR